MEIDWRWSDSDSLYSQNSIPRMIRYRIRYRIRSSVDRRPNSHRIWTEFGTEFETESGEWFGPHSVPNPSGFGHRILIRYRIRTEFRPNSVPNSIRSHRIWFAIAKTEFAPNFDWIRYRIRWPNSVPNSVPNAEMKKPKGVVKVFPFNPRKWLK